MKMRFLSTTLLFTCTLLVTLSLQTCDRGHMIPEEEGPSLQAANNDPPPCDSLDGSFTGTFQIVDPAPYGDYDLAVLILSMNYPEVPDGCYLLGCEHCVTLNFAYTEIRKVGITRYRETPIVVRELPVGNSRGTSGVPGSYIKCQPSTDGDLMLFNFGGSFPEGFSAETAVFSVGGNCIIDNIPDPGDGGG